jgi:FkbM family methyltransferase
MKAVLAKVLPAPVRPIARRVYRRLSGKPLDWTPEKYRALSALKCEVAYNRYGGYCVPESTRHRPASAAILSNEVWEPLTIEFMQRECRGGDIVHAGTYFGDFLPALAQGLAPNAVLWAFEPSMENYRCAKITAEINALSNVTLAHAGLGAQRARAFVRTIDEVRGPLGGGATIAADGAETVDIVTIDDAVDGRAVSLIQLDVEGYEEKALAGALRTIERCRPVLILEELSGSRLLGSEWFARNILSRGYRQLARLHDNIAFGC